MSHDPFDDWESAALVGSLAEELSVEEKRRLKGLLEGEIECECDHLSWEDDDLFP